MVAQEANEIGIGGAKRFNSFFVCGIAFLLMIMQIPEYVQT